MAQVRILDPDELDQLIDFYLTLDRWDREDKAKAISQSGKWSDEALSKSEDEPSGLRGR